MVAVALLDGEVTPAQYDPARILKQDVQDLMKKVTIRPDPAMSGRFPQRMPCRIQVEMSDGRKLSIEKDDYEGFYTRPMPWDKVVGKFNSIASPFASAAQRTAIVKAVGELENQPIARLTEVLNVSFEKFSPTEAKAELVGSR